MKFFTLLSCFVLTIFAHAQNPAIVKTVGGSVLEPRNADQNEWENNYWNGRYFYQGTGTPTKLIVTDGTAAGTQYIKDIGSGTILNTIAAQDFMYIITSRLITTPSFSVVHEIWKSDGTSAGTELVKTMEAFSFSAQGNLYTSDGQNKRNYSVNGNIMIFGGWDAANGRELWRTDGTTAGTYLVKDIKPGTGDSYTSNFVRLNDGYVYFRAAASGLGATLWRTDGTAAGTTEIAVPNLTVFSNFAGLINNKLIFYGNDNNVTGAEPWVSDGTVAGTYRLADINPGAANSSPATLQNLQFRFNEKYCFFISQTAAGKTLWRTDGTIAGTIQLTPDGLITEDNFSGGGYSSIQNNGIFWIGANSKIYFSDGTPAGTRLLRSDLYSAVNLYMYKGAGWFKNVTGNPSLPATLEGEPWRSDGTAANTNRALDVYTGTSGSFINSSQPFGFFSLNNKLYFFGNRVTGGGNLHLFEYNGDMSFNGTVAGNRWRDSANWNSLMPPGITDTAFIGAGLTANVDGARAYAGNLVMNAGSNINLVSATDSLFIHRNLAGTATTGAGMLVLKNFNGDTARLSSVFAANNLNVQGMAAIENDLTVSGNLNLSSNARLLLNNANLMLPGSSSSIIGDASNYVVTNGTGKLSISDIGIGGRTGPVLFPIGTAVNYNPLSISNAGTIDAFSARVSPGLYSSYSGEVPTGAAYSNNAVNAGWFISEAIAGGSNANVTLQWNAVQELPGFDRTQSRLGHFSGGSWQLGTAGNAAGTNPYSWSGSGYTSFSPFGVFNNAIILPVYNVRLSVIKNGPANKCEWKILGDHIDEVVLERSSNGREFSSIHASNSLQGFFEDNAPFSRSYYRLRLKESSGAAKYSSIAWIDREEKKAILVYPTVFNQSISVQNNQDAGATLKIFTSSGALALQRGLQKGTNTINAAELPSSLYFYQILADGKLIASGQLVKP